MDRTPPGQPADALSLPCHNFSDIRRRPLVIGKLDQVRLPFVVTMPQLAVGAIVFGLLFLTRAAWGAVMSDRLHIVVFVAVPILVAQQVSRTTVEGRPLSKAALGLVRLWLAPRHGTINGRRRRPPDRVPVIVHPLTDDRRPRARRTGTRRAPGSGDRGDRGDRSDRDDRGGGPSRAGPPARRPAGAALPPARYRRPGRW